ncbi:MAG TPA: hypothetical protein VF556_01475 [Pyrinomonadaceae bacterium]|jgi:hypothetical protein
MKILASIVILLFGISDGFACTCANMENISEADHSKYLKEVKAIFYGEVIEKGEKREITWSKARITDGFQAIKFKVLRAWKGIENSEIIVETNISSSCQYNPEIGSKVMVYAYENKEAKIPLYINYCSIGKFNQQKMKREYGEGKVFEEPERQIPKNNSSENFVSMIWQKIISFFS